MLQTPFLVSEAVRAYNGRMARALRDYLAEYPRIMLEAIAEGWGIALTDERSDEVVDRLAAEMTDPEVIQILLKRLGDAEREALALAVNKGQVRAHIMTRKYGDIPRLGPGRLEWERAWRDPASPLESLWFLGLLHRAYGLDRGYRGEVFFVPPDVLDALPSMSVDLADFEVERAPDPSTVKDEGDALARDVFAVLVHLRKNRVHAKKGVLAAHELARLRPRLAGSHRRQRMAFLHHVCVAAGLIRRDNGLWGPTDEAASWLKDGAVARGRILCHTWLEDWNWNDLCAMPGVRCEDTGWRSDPVLARKGILRYVAKCPASVWLTVASLVDSLHEVDPDFVRQDGDYDSWYIRDAHTGHYLMGFGNWERVEGALIRYVLEYPLRWLGVVAVGHPPGEERACCFKLTDRGAAILGLHEMEEDPVRRIIVHSSLQVTVPREASWYDRFLLERFARWVDEQQGATRYVINAESVGACLDDGVTVEQIVAFVRRATGGKVPARVLRSLGAWAQPKQPLGR